MRHATRIRVRRRTEVEATTRRISHVNSRTLLRQVRLGFVSTGSEATSSHTLLLRNEQEPSATGVEARTCQDGRGEVAKMQVQRQSSVQAMHPKDSAGRYVGGHARTYVLDVARKVAKSSNPCRGDALAMPNIHRV